MLNKGDKKSIVKLPSSHGLTSNKWLVIKILEEVKVNLKGLFPFILFFHLLLLLL